MLDLTDTFAAALDQAGVRSRVAGRLSASEQEGLLAVPGLDGGQCVALVAAMGAAVVEVEKLDDEVEGPIAAHVLEPARGKDIDLLDRYLADLHRHPTLSPAEELAFSRAARAGDAAGRRRLILGNLRLVVFIARRYR